jgi:hypothetical protein
MQFLNYVQHYNTLCGIIYSCRAQAYTDPENDLCAVRYSTKIFSICLKCYFDMFRPVIARHRRNHSCTLLAVLMFV